jgi:hypothetical protein
MILDFGSHDLMILKYLMIILKTYNHIHLYSDYMSYRTMLILLYNYIVILYYMNNIIDILSI